MEPVAGTTACRLLNSFLSFGKIPPIVFSTLSISSFDERRARARARSRVIGRKGRREYRERLVDSLARNESTINIRKILYYHYSKYSKYSSISIHRDIIFSEIYTRYTYLSKILFQDNILTWSVSIFSSSINSTVFRCRETIWQNRERREGGGVGIVDAFTGENRRCGDLGNADGWYCTERDMHAKMSSAISEIPSCRFPLPLKCRALRPPFSLVSRLLSANL